MERYGAWGRHGEREGQGPREGPPPELPTCRDQPEPLKHGDIEPGVGMGGEKGRGPEKGHPQNGMSQQCGGEDLRIPSRESRECKAGTSFLRINKLCHGP